MTHYDAVCICDARMSWMRFDMEVSSFSHISFNAGVDKTWPCQRGQRMRCWYAGDGAKTTVKLDHLGMYQWRKWMKMGDMFVWAINLAMSQNVAQHGTVAQLHLHSMVIFTGSMIHWTSVNSLVFFLERNMCLGTGPNRGPQIAAYVRQPSRFREIVPYTNMGLSENRVPLHPMVLLIIIPTKWLFHWGYTPFADIPICCHQSTRIIHNHP